MHTTIAKLVFSQYNKHESTTNAALLAAVYAPKGWRSLVYRIRSISVNEILSVHSITVNPNEKCLTINRDLRLRHISGKGMKQAQQDIHL